MLLRLVAPRVGLTTRVTLGLAVAACGGVSSLEAQARTEPREGPSWALTGLRSSQCVRFLIEPEAAAREGTAGYRPVRADQDPSLHPALRSAITGQPEFASWTPSALCFFYVDTVTVAGRTMTDKNVRKPQMMAVWTLAATEQGGGRRDLVLDLSSSSARVVRAAEAAKLRVDDAEAVVSKARESTDELHQVTVGKTRLAWTGRAVGDSTRIEQRHEESWLVKGASGVMWNVRMVLTPVWSRPLVGLLRVEGKDKMANALKASPIRFVGPRYLGGGAELFFSR